MADFEKSEVWQKSRELVKFVYDRTKKFPKEEIQGLAQEIRSSAVLISSSIAKGAESKKIEHFDSALSRIFELQSHLIVALDLGYLWNSDIEILNSKIEEIQKLLQ